MEVATTVAMAVVVLDVAIRVATTAAVEEDRLLRASCATRIVIRC
jgi:hypothetical protein